MALTEQDRIKLYRHLEADMGEELATKMMDSLPPAGWGDVATKQDLVLLKEDLEGQVTAGFDRIERRFETLEHAIDHRFETLEHAIDHRFELVDHRFELVDHRFETLEHVVEHRFGMVYERFETMEYKLGRQFYRALVTQTLVFTAVVGAVATLTDFFRG